MTRLGLFVLTACAATASAFKHTSPLLAWSSDPAYPLGELQSSSAVVNWEDAHRMLSIEDLCAHEGIFLVEHSGLHSSDLRFLPATSRLSQRIRSAASSLDIPRFISSHTHTPLANLSKEIGATCGHVSLHGYDALEKLDIRPDTKYAFHWSLPTLEGSEGDRKSSLSQHEDMLCDHLDEATALFPSHLVVLFGAAAAIAKRQSAPTFSSAPAPFFDSMQIAPNSTMTPFLSRYQILTPGLVSALLVVFVIFLPIMLIGVSTLASIQSPVRMEAPKGPSAEKKHQ